MNGLRRFVSTPEGAAGATILLVLALAALAAPLLFPGDPLAIVAEPMLPNRTRPSSARYSPIALKLNPGHMKSADGFSPARLFS